MRRVLLCVALALCCVPAQVCAQASEPGAALPALRDGDIVFQTLATVQSAGIIAATGVPYTHMGIVKMTDGGPVVVEAAGPVRETPWPEWRARGVGGRVMVARVAGLTPGQAAGALAAARAYYGQPYDTHFAFDNGAQYCSELVYLAFRDGAGITLGRVEALGDLAMDAPPARALLHARWAGHPACAGAQTLAECLPALEAQELVTPEAIARDARVGVLYSDYP